MTGSPSKKMRWKFITQSKIAGVTIRIPYPSALSRSVMKDGEEIAYNAWDKAVDPANHLPGYGPIEQKKCGENRYIGVKNILEFYIDANCELYIQPRDAIQTKVRMEWTMKAFMSKGGTTTFIDRLCGSLGIHASTVKVVSVYEGSLNVDYEITPNKDEPMSLEQIKKRQTEKFATGKVDLGAPVLDVAAGEEKLVSDGVTVAAGF